MTYPHPLARWLGRRLWGKSLTPTRGAVRLPGLEQRVEVYRDRRGVPHIDAPDEESLFVAQGYCAAQDRLWQMDFLRMTGSGRMAELVGDRPAPWEDATIHFKGGRISDIDIFMRTIGLPKAAAEGESLLGAEARSAIDAYARGVNLYIDAYPKALPPEFRILGHRPEPWTIRDTLLIAKLMAFQLSFAWRTKLARAAIAARLAAHPEKAAALDFSYPEDGPTILSYLGARGVEMTVIGIADLEAAARTFAGWSGLHAGSNNWVVSGAHTADGHPIVCNDPHLGLTAPGAWSQAHLKGGRYDVTGVTLPGTPGISIGHNRQIAWGITNVTADDVDYYIEKFNPENPQQVKSGTRWVDLKIRDEVIRVKGGPDRRVQVRETRNGPLMTDLLADFTRPESGHGLSMKWVGHDPEPGLDGLIGINTAQNFAEFRDACSTIAMGHFNFVYADTDGHIAYQMTGKLPQRLNGPNRVPVPGWERKYQWAKSYVPFEEMPCALDPPEGKVVTANNKTVGEDYPHYISDFFEPPHRSQRIHELLSSKEKLTTDDMRLFQFDTVSIFARTIVNDVIRPLAEELSTHEDSKQAVALLLTWNADCHPTSAAALLFETFYVALMRRLFRLALGENLWAAYFELLNEAIPPTETILLDETNPWWEGKRTRVIEEALRDAWSQCIATQGGNHTTWQWGKAHGRVLPHPLGGVKALQPLFGIGPITTGGDGLTVNNGTFLYRHPFEHFSGPSMRFVCNLGNLPDTWIVANSGQSGNPLSPHYDDQTWLWEQGRYQHDAFEPQEYQHGHLLVLLPDAQPAST